MVGDTVNKAGQTSAQAVRVPEERLAEDLRTLLERNSYTDVTLRTIVDKTQGHPGFQEFRAHKAILAGKARFSECFLAFLENLRNSIHAA